MEICDICHIWIEILAVVFYILSLLGLKCKANNYYFAFILQVLNRLVSCFQQRILYLLHLYYRSFRLVSSLQQLILYLYFLGLTKSFPRSQPNKSILSSTNKPSQLD